MQFPPSGIIGTSGSSEKSRKSSLENFVEFLTIKNIPITSANIYILQVSADLIQQFGTYLKASRYKENGVRKLIMAGSFSTIIILLHCNTIFVI